jgi:5-methylcytosine-specific restriction endonuclease McrA
MATERQKQAAWEKAKKMLLRNPNLWKRDSLGNPIYKPAYGTEGKYGWEVDHIRPKARGGSDSPRNLQALQTAANREKEDKLRKGRPRRRLIRRRKR